VGEDRASGVGAICPDEAALLAEIASRSAGQSRAENFPVALRLLPRRPRAQLDRVYAFARFVDDVGDTAPGDRLRLLDLIDTDVRSLRTGAPTLAPVAALRPMVEDCAIPVDTLLDLVEANRVDQHTTSYQTFDDLLRYCQLSAAPVGRIVLHVAGAATERNVADSDSVCAALQVLEHCQDVGEDARAGRVYLPATDLRRAGVAQEELLDTTTSPAVKRVVAVQVERARGLLQAGNPLVGRLSGWARFAVAGYVAGGLATATALHRADFDVLAHEIRPSRLRTAAQATRLVARR
jgi:squalene synthase HpnC